MQHANMRRNRACAVEKHWRELLRMLYGDDLTRWFSGLVFDKNFVKKKRRDVWNKNRCHLAFSKPEN